MRRGVGVGAGSGMAATTRSDACEAYALRCVEAVMPALRSPGKRSASGIGHRRTEAHHEPRESPGAACGLRA